MTLDEFVDHLRSLGAEMVYLFGSVAKGTPRPDSDVDLYCVVGSDDARRAIDRAYYLDRPIVLVDGVSRPAHVSTESTTRTNDPKLFRRMSPEARRVDAERAVIAEAARALQARRWPDRADARCEVCGGPVPPESRYRKYCRAGCESKARRGRRSPPGRLLDLALAELARETDDAREENINGKP